MTGIYIGLGFNLAGIVLVAWEFLRPFKVKSHYIVCEIV